MKNSDKCLGCGSTKQTLNNNKQGYVKSLEHEYCFDCFQLMNYGKSYKHYHPNDYLEIKSGSLIFIVQSVMQLDLLFSQPITRIQPNAKYVYIINQIDLLPKDTNLDYILLNVKKLANKNNVEYEDIIFMSALNTNDINNLSKYILRRNESDFYLFGFQNSGKSTILKGLTKNNKVLSINKAGLTQEIITDKLGNKTIYDMPGTYVKGYLSDFFDFSEYRKMLPEKTIKPKVYQLRNTQKLVINNFIEISFNGRESTSLVFYLKDFNKIMKYNMKNENKYLKDSFDYISKTFKTGNNKTQITIADLLFFQTNENINITIKVPKNMHLTFMESIIK